MNFILNSCKKVGWETSFHDDKMIILQNERDFKTIVGFSIWFKIMLNFIDKFECDIKLKSRIEKILTIGANLDTFNVGDFGDYKKEEYFKKINEGSKNIFNKPNIENLMNEHSLVKINNVLKEQYEENIKEIKNISVYDENTLRLFIPEEIVEKYKYKTALLIEKNTNNFYKDSFVEIVKCLKGIKIINEIKDYQISNSISTLNCLQDIGMLVEFLIKTVDYISTSKSFKEGRLLDEDEYHLKGKINIMESIIENSVRFVS